MTTRKVDGLDLVTIYPDTWGTPTPTYHLPGYLRIPGPDEADEFTTKVLCGIPTADRHAHVLQLRHAHRFARICERCQDIAGILILDDPPVEGAEFVVINPDETFL